MSGAALRQEAIALQQKKKLFNKEENLLLASDKFKQAGNAFRADRQFPEAAECYESAASILEGLKKRREVLQIYLDIYKMYEKQPDTYMEAISALEKAIDLKIKLKQELDAADLHLQAGRFLIKNNQNEDGIKHIETGCDMFIQFGNSERAAKGLISLADLMVEQREFLKAAKFYQKAAKVKLMIPLTQHASIGLTFKCILCLLRIDDAPGAQKVFKQFSDDYPSWQTTMEYKYADSMITCLQLSDAAAYAKLAENFEKVRTFDQFTAESVREIGDIINGVDDEELL